MLAGGFGTPVRAETTPEMAAVTANDRAFEAAYAKGDVKAVADFFADDADYTSDDGRTFSGRDAIEGVLRNGFRDNKGATLTIKTDSVRALAPDVFLERGLRLRSSHPRRPPLNGQGASRLAGCGPVEGHGVPFLST